MHVVRDSLCYCGPSCAIASYCMINKEILDHENNHCLSPKQYQTMKKFTCRYT